MVKNTLQYEAKITIWTLLFSILISSLSTVEAQRISAGGGVGFGSESENLNFQINAYFSPSNTPIRLGGDVGYSMPERESNFRMDIIESNANVHFMAVDEEVVSIYSITGLNVTHSRARTSFDSQPSVTDSDTETGLNLGIGGEFKTGKGRTYGEIKYVTGRSNGDSFVVGGGVRIRI